MNLIKNYLVFQHLPLSGNSYCVDGFIVQRQAPTGSVIRERVELGASYSFEWNQELQAVSVEAYNILGSSANNMKMTLEKQPKRKGMDQWAVSSPALWA